MRKHKRTIKMMCIYCKTWFWTSRTNAMFCSGRCKVAAHRAKKRDENLPAIADALIASTNLGRLRDNMRKR